MNVLFLAPEVPYPVRHGGHVRSFGMVRCLSRFAAVRVMAIGAPDAACRPGVRAAFEAMGATVEAFLPTGPGRRLGLVSRRPHALWHYWSPPLAQALRAEAGDAAADLVFVEEAVMAQYAHLLGRRRVLDRQKIEWVYHRRVRHALAAGERLSPRCWLRSARSRLEARRFRRWDRQLAGLFHAVLVLGEGDRSLLAPLYAPAPVHVVPNGVDAAIAMPACRTTAVDFALLYGSLDYPPNAEGHEWYFRQVWPALRVALPRLRTLVVGHGRPLRPLPDDPRVESRGFVEDVAGVLSGPGVLVVPLRVGGGIRNKILEALAAGMPVVSSAAGAENLGLEDGRHYLNADSPAQVVESVLRLADDPALCARLSTEGSRLVEERYRWEPIAARVESVCREAVAAAASAS